MPRHKMLMTTLLGLLAACGQEPTTPTTHAEGLSLKTGQGPVVHQGLRGRAGRVHRSRRQAGMRRKLLVIAIQRADGSVTGRLPSAACGPADGLHAVIDCLLVQEIPERTPVALEAWVGGVAGDSPSQPGRPPHRCADAGQLYHRREWPSRPTY